MITRADKGISRNQWIPARTWNTITAYVPLACLDVIFQRNDGSILFGFRKIEPYRNVWCIVGGRILKTESLLKTARRIAREYGITFRELYLIGVFPRTFVGRSDVSICVAACGAHGDPRIDGKEFSRLEWRANKPASLGLHHSTMLNKWMTVRNSKEFLRLNRL